MLVGAGFVFFFLAERALVLHHRDDDEHIHAHAQVGALGAAGLSLHSFIDGLGIGLAFGLSTETGLLVFVAVRRARLRRRPEHGRLRPAPVGRPRSARSAGSRSTPPPRSPARSSARRSRSRRRASATLLAVYAGFFLFMGATDLLPHAHEHPSVKRVALTLAGFGAIFLVSLIGH